MILVLLLCCKHAPTKMPDHLPLSANTNYLKQTYGAIDAATLQMGSSSVYAVVFQDSKSDFRIVCFQKQPDGYHRVGAEVNLLEFSRPAISTDDQSRVLRTTHLSTKEGYKVVTTGAGCDVLPDNGAWEQVKTVQ